MQIIHITSEFAPLAKEGGLGDVVYGLTKQLAKQVPNTSVILPKYPYLTKKKLSGFKICKKTPLFNAFVKLHEGITIYLIEPKQRGYFLQKGIYGGKKEFERFWNFCVCASKFLETHLLEKTSIKTIIHVHDWVTAPLLNMIKLKKSNTSVLTIHNMQHQGSITNTQFRSIKNQQDLYTPASLQDPHIKNRVNLLHSGILLADIVTTVSPNYMKEIQTKPHGFGLDGVLRKNKSKLHGILNGIDSEYWNPKKDLFLSHVFSSSSSINKDKEKNLNALKKKFPDLELKRPLISCITRLVSQKGPELIKEGAIFAQKNNTSFFLLASTPDPKLKVEFHKLKKQLESKGSSSQFQFEFDEELAHLLYAASDIMLIPSLFEPCGLTQLISMKYGTIPIAHRVGGLCDTIINEKNGFLFNKPTKEVFLKTLQKAVNCFENEKSSWKQLQLNGIKSDFSWNKSASKYLQLYRKSR